MPYYAQNLCDQLEAILLDSRNLDCQFASVDGIADYNEHSLVFISEASQLFAAADIKPAVVVTNREVATQIKDETICVIEVSDVRLAQAIIKQHYSDYQAADAEWSMIHESAVIHPSAQLGSNVRIGPNTVIGSDVRIGNNAIIRANCVIEHNAVIGKDTVIHNLVNIGYHCMVGNGVIVRPGAIIGNEGFGFAKSAEGKYQRIPHTGIVVIEDDVHIGSNCNIDRGTYGETRIAKGVKLDAMCHIAHNVTVDEDALLTAQCVVAGSSHIGKRVMASGQTGVLDHRTIADDAVLVHRCGVIEDIPSAGIWAGTPSRPFKQYVKNLNLEKILLKRIEQLESEIAALKK